MTSAAWQQTLERIQAEARQLDPARVALTLIAAPLFVVGWLLGKTLAALWIVVAWSWTAAVVGYRGAGGPRGRPGTPRGR